jgi:Mn2+/Fe2+ NRAMP family transporter
VFEAVAVVGAIVAFFTGSLCFAHHERKLHPGDVIGPNGQVIPEESHHHNTGCIIATVTGAVLVFLILLGACVISMRSSNSNGSNGRRSLRERHSVYEDGNIRVTNSQYGAA